MYMFMYINYFHAHIYIYFHVQYIFIVMYTDMKKMISCIYVEYELVHDEHKRVHDGHEHEREHEVVLVCFHSHRPWTYS